MVKRISIVIFGFSIGLLGLVASAAHREALVAVAFDRLGFYLNEIYETHELKFNAEEERMLSQIVNLAVANTQYRAYRHYNMASFSEDKPIPEFGLRFSDDQNRFILKDNPQPRTAVTTADKDSDIEFNLNIINAPSTNINFLDVIQLLIHELGHKVQDKDQAAVDSLAVKIKNHLVKYYLRQVLTDGRTVEMLSLSRTKEDKASYADSSLPGYNIVPLAEKELTLLITHDQIVEDFSSIFYEPLYQKQILVNLENPLVPEIVDTRLQIEGTALLPLSGNKGSVVQVQMLRESRVIQSAFGIAGRFYSSPEALSAPRENSIQLMVNIRIPPGQAPFFELNKTRTRNFDSEIKLVSSAMLDNRNLLIVCEVPENTKGKSISLVVNFDGGEYLITGKREGSDAKLVNFRLKLPQKTNAQWLYFDRVLLEQNIEVFLNRGRKIDLIPKEQLKEVNFELAQIVQINADAKLKLVLQVDSRSAIKQVKIVRYKILNGHQNPTTTEKLLGYGDYRGIGGPIYSSVGGEVKNWHYIRDEIILTESQFKQSRKASGIWTVEIELPESDVLTEYTLLGENITQTISRFSKISNLVYYPVRSDTGNREIEEIELTNSQLQTVRKQIGKPYNTRYHAPKCSEIFDEEVGYSDAYI